MRLVFLHQLLSLADVIAPSATFAVVSAPLAILVAVTVPSPGVGT